MSLKNNFDFDSDKFNWTNFNSSGSYMYDRFDLEDSINHMEDINDQLNLLVEDLIESEDVDIDEVCNTIQGVINIHSMRTKRLWDHFKGAFNLRG